MTTTPPDPNPVTQQDPLAAYEGRINYHLHKHGLGGDLLAKTKARVLASKALKSYDPTAGASVDTWLDRSLQPLSRFKRERSFAIQLPERAILDNFEVRRAELEFEDKHGRLPDFDELADAAGVSLKRIAALRKAVRPQVAESAVEGQLSGSIVTDHTDEALTAVWQEADAIDRKIIELKTGFGGRHVPITSEEVASRLSLTPVQVSRRSARMAAKLDALLELMEKRQN